MQKIPVAQSALERILELNREAIEAARRRDVAYEMLKLALGAPSDAKLRIENGEGWLVSGETEVAQD